MASELKYLIKRDGSVADFDPNKITSAIEKAGKAVECLIAEGPDKAMNQFNG